MRALAVRYGLTLAAVAGATGVRTMFDPLVGNQLPWVTFTIPVALAAWFGGFYPALLATLLGYMAGLYLFVAPRYTLRLVPTSQWSYALTTYFLVCLTLAFFGEAMRNARRRAEARGQLLEATLAGIADAVVAAKPTGGVIFLNGPAATLIGWTPEEAMGRPLAEVIQLTDGKTSDRCGDPIGDAMRQGQPIRLPGGAVLIARDGAERRVEGTAAPIRDATGAVVGGVLALRDITDRKRAEEAVAAREREFQTLVEHLPDIVSRLDRQARHLYVSPSVERASGLSPSAFLGKSNRDLGMPGWFCDMVEQTVEGVFATGREARNEFTFPGPDGERHYESVMVPELGPNGSVETLLGLVRDVTDLKRSASAARESEARYRWAVESISDAFIQLDPDWRYRYVNARASDTSGLAPEAMLGKTIWELFPAVVGTEMESRCRRAVATGQAERFEYYYPPSDRWYEQRLYPSEVGLTIFSADITDRRRAEERFGRLAEAVPQIVWTAAPDGIITYINGRWTEYTGLSLQETNQLETLLGAIHPDDTERVFARWAESLATGRPHEVQWRFRRKSDGVYRWFLTRALAVRDERGAIREWFGTATDIDDWKRTADALRESDATLRAFFDSAPACMGITEPTEDGDILHVADNHATCRFFGVQPGATDGRRALADLKAEPQVVRVWLAAYEQSGAAGRPGQFEHEHATEGGSRWLSATVCPIGPGPTGRMRFCYVADDVTDRRRAEAALRESEEKYRFLVNTVPALVWSCRPDGTTDFHNERWFAYTGLSPATQTEADLLHVCHSDDVGRAIEAWTRSVRTGEPYRVEYRLRRGSDGEYRWWQAEAMPMRDKGGRVIRWFGTCTDIHDRRLAEQELQAADRRKDEFIATLAHELRNPLAPIRNAVQIFKAKKQLDPELTWGRDVIERQVTQMARLLDDLLDVSRITCNKLQLRRERITLAEAVESAVETSRPVIDDGGHELTITLPPEPIELDADRLRLAQVFANLLNNAAKYTDRGGHIQLIGKRVGHEAVVSVKDNGIGIEQDLLPGLFEMFSQATPALERAQGGLGIGLSLVRGLVEMHGGTVVAYSDGPGKGSEFVVRLPVAMATSEQRPAEVENPPSPAACKVLVADDNRDAADSLAMLLGIMGHEVRTANDGLQATEVAEAFRPDLILLDIGMPKMNGCDAARRIREQPWGKSVMLVALTGWGQDEDRRNTMEAGFDLHLTKPVAPARLEQLLAEVHADTS